MLLQYFIYFILTLSIDQMSMGSIGHNPVGKQKLLIEKNFGGDFPVASFTRFSWYLSLCQKYT